MTGLLAVALLALILGLGLRFEPLVYLFYALVGVYIVNRFWLSRSLRALRGRRLIGQSSAGSDHSAFLGDRLTVTVQIRNSGLLPVAWLTLTETLPAALRPVDPAQWTLTLPPRERRAVTYVLHCARRGYYPIGPLHVTGGTPWEAERGEIELAPETPLTVYPHIVPLPALGLPSRLPLGDRRSSNPLLPDPSRLVGVREYAPGDRLRDIHWQASARTGALQVKKFEPSQPLQVALFLDLDADAYDFRTRDRASELAIVVAASLAVHIADQRQAVGLVSNGHDPLADPTATPAGEPVALAPAGDMPSAEVSRATSNGTPAHTPAAEPVAAVAAHLPSLPATDRLTAAPVATVERPRRILATDPYAPATLPEETYDEEAGGFFDGDVMTAPPAPPVVTPVHDGRGHLASLLAILARITLRERPSESSREAVHIAPLPFTRLVRRRSAGLAWGTTIILIAARPSEELLTTMLHLRRSGFTPLAVFVQPPRLATEFDAATIRAAGLTAWEVYDEGRLADLQLSHVRAP
jgi:uncharacterized protein (DUF58 family)